MIRKVQYNAYGDPSVLEMVETDGAYTRAKVKSV